MLLPGLIFAVTAADWVSGSYLLVGVWHRVRLRLAARPAALSPTPLADEVEEWLRGG